MNTKKKYKNDKYKKKYKNNKSKKYTDEYKRILRELQKIKSNNK